MATTAGFLMLALLPSLGFARDALSAVEGRVAAAVSSDAAAPAHVPVAIAEPMAAVPLIPVATSGRILPEPGLLVLVGTGLMGLGAIVRRTTRI